MSQNGNSYSLPREKENILQPAQIFSPQCLLNNPITDLKHSQYVHSYMKARLDKEESTNNINMQKAMNISVRKDLHTHSQRVQSGINKLDNVVIDLSNRKTRVDEISKPSTEENRRYDDEYQSENINKRKSSLDRYKSIEPASKIPKLLKIEQTSERLEQVDKIHADCMIANKQDIHGNYPLHNAVLQSNLKLVRRFSRVLTAMKKTLDLINKQFMTPLLLAVYHRQPSTVSYLLRLGADPSLATLNGNTSYHLAVQRSDPKTLKELLKKCTKNEHLDIFNDEGLTPLHLAVMRKDASMVKSLLASGAKPELQDARSGKTALNLASELGCPEVGDLLTVYGAGSAPTNYSAFSPEGSAKGQKYAQAVFRGDLLEYFIV